MHKKQRQNGSTIKHSEEYCGKCYYRSFGQFFKLQNKFSRNNMKTNGQDPTALTQHGRSQNHTFQSDKANINTIILEDTPWKW